MSCELEKTKSLDLDMLNLNGHNSRKSLDVPEIHITFADDKMDQQKRRLGLSQRQQSEPTSKMVSLMCHQLINKNSI